MLFEMKPPQDVREPLDLDLDAIKVDEGRGGEGDTLLPPPPPGRRKGVISRMKSGLTPRNRRSTGRLESAGLDETAAALAASYKHALKKVDPPMDIVADAVECNTRPEIAQYFKMTVAELDLVSAAPSRATLVAMDKKRRMTPRSAGRPNINEGAEVDLKFDGEPVTSFFYNLTKAEVRAIADRAAEPGSPREVINVGDVEFSFEALKAGIAVRVKTYRKHVRPGDYHQIFGAARLPDLTADLPMPPSAKLL